MAATTKTLTGDAVIKASRGKVHWILITATGATIGDLWEIQDGEPGSAWVARGSVQAAQGTWMFPFVIRPGDPGLVCASKIHFSTNAAAGKLNATVGYE